MDDDLSIRIAPIRGAGIRKSQVSRLCCEIDERVQTLLHRPIESLPGEGRG